MEPHELVQWVFNAGILLLGGLGSFILNRLCSALEKLQRLEISLASSIATYTATTTEKEKMDALLHSELEKINIKLDTAPCRMGRFMKPN